MQSCVHTYVHVHTLDTHARVKCVASTYGTYAHSYYECHIITTYTYMLEGEISLSQVPDAWCLTSQVPLHTTHTHTQKGPRHAHSNGVVLQVGGDAVFGHFYTHACTTTHRP